MKKTVRLTENELKSIVRKIILESNKLTNSFKSKEDATEYRDMYSPDDPDKDSGPFHPYSHTTMDDGYDYCGDDMYNDDAREANRGLSHRLSTKGGQMSYDMDKLNARDNMIRTKHHKDAEAAHNRRTDANRKYQAWADRLGNKARRKYTDPNTSLDDFQDWNDDIDYRGINKHLSESTKKTLNRMLHESNTTDDFFNDEDSNGKHGQPGMIKSYDIGHYTTDNAESDAKENGYNNLEDYLRSYWNEVGYECPFEWVTPGNGYGWNGKTIFTDGGLKCKDIFGQIIFDEYPPEEYTGKDNPSYEEWSDFLNGKEPVFEFGDGNIVYVDYDEKNGTLCSGFVTNVGFHKDGDVEVPVKDGHFDWAMDNVYEQLCAKYDNSLDESISRAIKKALSKV